MVIHLGSRAVPGGLLTSQHIYNAKPINQGLASRLRHPLAHTGGAVKRIAYPIPGLRAKSDDELEKTRIGLRFASDCTAPLFLYHWLSDPAVRCCDQVRGDCATVIPREFPTKP